MWWNKRFNRWNKSKWIYCFKINIFRKRFDDFDDGIELFMKIQSGEITLESKMH